MIIMKIQYSLTDLAYKLRIGDIHEAHLAEQGGEVYLRIDCEESPFHEDTEEYKTVKIEKPKKSPAKPKPQRASSKEPAGIGGKVLSVLSDIGSRPMKRPDQW